MFLAEVHFLKGVVDMSPATDLMELFCQIVKKSKKDTVPTDFIEKYEFIEKYAVCQLSLLGLRLSLYKHFVVEGGSITLPHPSSATE